MKFLILGGTKFLGRHTVEAALARGHEVTIFTRGLSNPELFPQVERLRGDREGDLGALRARLWDVVIDTSGYVPGHVRDSAELLADSVRLYVFISTISVYGDFSRPIDEDSPVAELPQGESVEEFKDETYGALKALCEREAEAVMPGRVLNIRPGLIVGPHDPTNRFTYWTGRVERGGEVLAPGYPEKQVQFIDVRDLSDWTLRMAEGFRAGVYNATGPDYRLTMGGFLEECRSVSGSDATFTWVGEEFLLERGVAPWNELPMWLADAHRQTRYHNSVSIEKALAAGLSFRPLARTIRDTLDWQHEGEPPPPKDGVATPDKTLTPERERELLAEWNERREVMSNE